MYQRVGFGQKAHKFFKLRAIHQRQIFKRNCPNFNGFGKVRNGRIAHRHSRHRRNAQHLLGRNPKGIEEQNGYQQQEGDSYQAQDFFHKTACSWLRLVDAIYELILQNQMQQRVFHLEHGPFDLSLANLPNWE